MAFTFLYLFAFAATHWVCYTWFVSVWPFWYSLGITVGFVVLYFVLAATHSGEEPRAFPF
jgi:hypothetical protein